MKTEVLNLRIDADLKEALKKLAEKDGRTLSNYVIFQLKQIADSKKVKR